MNSIKLIPLVLCAPITITGLILICKSLLDIYFIDSVLFLILFSYVISTCGLVIFVLVLYLKIIKI